MKVLIIFLVLLLVSVVQGEEIKIMSYSGTDEESGQPVSIEVVKDPATTQLYVNYKRDGRTVWSRFKLNYINKVTNELQANHNVTITAENLSMKTIKKNPLTIVSAGLSVIKVEGSYYFHMNVTDSNGNHLQRQRAVINDKGTLNINEIKIIRPDLLI